MAHSSVRFSKHVGRIVILVGFVAGNVVTPALAGPSGGRIIAGQGAISQAGPSSTINQGTDRLIIEWQNFDTSAGESVRFNQPSSSASVLNRIISGNATVFDGSLFANGNVVIVNGSGIHFGPNSRIDVGSLIASTADISNSNFLNNRLIFDRPGQPDASITNAGTITVRDTGLAALVAPGVENSGLIQANLGTVILAAGEAHTIDFNGDGLMSFTVTKPTTAKPKDRNGKTLDALVSNKGEIRADGGTVLLTARQASRVLDNSINMSGVVRANSVGVRNGKIVLFGGKRGRVNVSGKIRARGKSRGQRGGRVHITGRKVAVPIAKVDVTGKAGGGEVLIGGAYKGGKLAGDSSIGYLQSGDLVSILTGANAGAAGNGYIPTAEGVYIGQDTVIDVSATEAGNGGRAILWADGTTIFNGSIRARGGEISGDGGFVETSGAGRLGVGATANVDALAPNGRVGDWLLDPLSVTIATGGTATLAEIADGTDVISNLTVDPTTFNNAMANVSIVASDFITFTDAVTMVNAGVGLTATAGNLITVNAALSTNNGDVALNSIEYAINATVNAGTGSIGFNTGTVNLDGNLTAAGGITGTASTVNVLGSTGGAEIQDGVDVAAAGATVNVAAGFYSRFIIDKANLTVNGAGATTIVNAASPAITIAANGAMVQNMLLQGTGIADDVGILLDGTTTPGLTGITITNVDFSNLDDGIRSQGDIGDGVATNVDVTIAGNSNTDRAIFSDFLDAAIDVGDTTGNDAVYVVRDVIVQDGADNNAVSAVDGFRFGSIGAATIQGTMISAVSDDGIDFNNTLTNATILVGGLPAMPETGNSISAGQRGIETTTINGGSFVAAGNSVVGGFDGISFGRIFNNANVGVAGNTLIQGGFEGVVFRDIDTGTVAVAGNTQITGTQFDGIAFFGEINDSSVTIGPANVTIGTTGTAFGANTITGGFTGIAHIEGGAITGTSVVTYAGNAITGGIDGIFFDRIVDSAQVNVTDNTNITGTGDNGIRFSQQIEGNPSLTISGNPITGGENGISFGDLVDTASATGIQINNNSRITGSNGDGILFERLVTETIIGLHGNPNISGNINGVYFASISGTDVTVGNSRIRGGTTGFNVFGAASAGNRNHLTFQNSTIQGTTDAGLKVTTISLGTGVTTNLNGGVTLTGLPSMALSGPNQALVGNSLNDTRFNSVNGGNFVELSDGALFEPGQPTLIDGRDAFFDGVPVPDMSPAALIQAVEDRLIDFDDDTTLGQIFFTPFVPGPVEVETELETPVALNLDFLIGQFNFILESGIRLINPQTPGDWIQRPDYLFDILFGDLLAMTYPLGGCSPVFGGNGVLVNVSCIGPAQGFDISPFVADYMADLNIAAP